MRKEEGNATHFGKWLQVPGWNQTSGRVLISSSPPLTSLGPFNVGPVTSYKYRVPGTLIRKEKQLPIYFKPFIGAPFQAIYRGPMSPHLQGSVVAHFFPAHPTFFPRHRTPLCCAHWKTMPRRSLFPADKEQPARWSSKWFQPTLKICSSSRIISQVGVKIESIWTNYLVIMEYM